MRRLAAAAAVLALAACGAAPGGRGRAAEAATSGSTSHLEYVFNAGSFSVYDIDHGQRRVQTVSLPSTDDGIRGAAVIARAGMLFIAHGGDSDDSNGGLLSYDLVHRRVVRDQRYPFGIDSLDVTPDGSRIYMPGGEGSSGGTWHVIDANSGDVVGQIDAGTSPHDTVVSPDGSRVYLGPRNTPWLYVASTATNQIIRRIGPLRGGVRPFTIDARQRFAFTTATGQLGFQVASIQSGRVLYTVGFGRRFGNNGFAGTAPSHGVSLSPDGRQLWVVDGPNSYVHVFDVSRLPRHAPRRIRDIRLTAGFTGTESQCAYDCNRDGWLQHSLNGRYVYVGDSGEVLSARTGRRAGFIPALRNTRVFLEVDWRGGVPVATSSRLGLGRRAG